jgi:excisionase family DNA binding protein
MHAQNQMNRGKAKAAAQPPGARMACGLATVREACVYAQMSHRKLYDLIGAGKISAFKDGGRTLIALASINAYYRKLPPMPRRRRRKAQR